MPVETPGISIDPYKSTVPTVQMPPQEFGQPTPGQPLPGRFGPGHGTGIMAVGDSILKGFLQGHEYKAQKKAAEAQATLAAADSSTNAAYQKYQDALSSASGDVNNPAAQAAYNAYKDVFAKGKEAKAKYVIPQEDEKKKPKGAKDKIKGMFSNIGEFMQANPHVVPQLALLSMQPNPPGLSPEGKRQAAEQTRVSGEAALGEIDLQEARRKKDAEKTFDQYSGLNEAQIAALPASEQEKFQSAKNVLYPPRQTGTAKPYITTDGKKVWAYPGQEPEGAQAAFNENGAAGGVKIGTFGDYVTRWAKENGVDPGKVTTEQMDALKKRYAWDSQHDSTTSTTVRPGIDSTTTTSSRSAGGPPPMPSVGGGPITRPPASAAHRGTTRGGGITAPPGSESNPSPTRARLTMQANHAKESKIAQASQKRTAVLLKNQQITDPTLKQHADDTANAEYEKQVKSAEHEYDQATRAVGGTPGGKPAEAKKADAGGAPKGATVAYKDKNGVIQGYAVNGQYVPVSK